LRFGELSSLVTGSAGRALDLETHQFQIGWLASEQFELPGGLVREHINARERVAPRSAGVFDE
jgi:hypothetical protein